VRVTINGEEIITRAYGDAMTGVPGMCTIHASSAREALVKMCNAAVVGR
jgi:hypothetical protein